MRNNFKNNKPPANQSANGTPYFWGYGAGEWVIVKDRIIAEFKANNCWDFVNPKEGQDLSGNAVDAEGNPILVEAAIDEVKPSEKVMVKKKLRMFDRNVLEWYTKSMLQVEDITDEDEKQKRIVKIESLKLEKEFSRFKEKELFINKFDEAKRRYTIKEQEHSDKVSKVLKIFGKSLKERPLALVQKELEQQKFRHAWLKMDKYFLTKDGNSQVKMMSIEGINSLRYEETVGLETFLYRFNQLWEKVGSDDEHIKVGYFKNCLDKSRTNPFRETISHLNLKGFTPYDEMVEIMYRKEMDGRGKRDFRQMMGSMPRESVQVASYGDEDMSRTCPGHVQDNVQDNVQDKRSKSNANVSVDAGPGKTKSVCTYCNRPGHSRATCWDLIPCSVCGKYGHDGKFCKGAKVGLNVNSNRNGPKKGASGGSNGTKLGAPRVKDSFVKKKLFKAKNT
jgi:hypothetical protein